MAASIRRVSPRSASIRAIAGHVTVGVSTGGVWVTDDGGTSWRASVDGMYAEYFPPPRDHAPQMQDVHRLVQCPAAPDTMWAQHHNGVFRSTDGARSWQEVTTIRPAKFGFAVAAHPTDADTAWFVPGVKDECRIPVDGRLVVARTRDGARSFDVLSDGLPQSHAYDLVHRHGLAIDDSGTPWRWVRRPATCGSRRTPATAGRWSPATCRQSVAYGLPEMSDDTPNAAPATRQSNQSFFFESDIFSAGRLIARRARPGGVVHEAARAIPVFRDCDVLVVGGGPSGTAAAVAAARTGADVVLLERYNHLGGLSTGGLVIWIDRMTDWSGAQVIRGIANDLLDRLPKDAIAGPPRGLWGSADAATAAYWRERTAAYHGIVTWSPTIDPERLKLASQELVLESGVHLLLHGTGDGADHGRRRGRRRGVREQGRPPGNPRARHGGLHRRRRHLRPRRRRRRHRHRGARHPSLHEHRPGSGAAAT